MYTARDTATRSEAAYSELKRDILLGQYRINARLGEERLASALSMSRTPVREALARLHAEGLVARHPDGGYTPAVPDVVAIHELYEVRCALERCALRRPQEISRRHDAAQLLALRDEWLALGEDGELEPDPAFVLLDESFHETLAEAAGNAALADVLRQVNQRIRIVRMQDFLVVDRVETTVAEHLCVVDHLIEGRIDAAEAALRAHIEASMRFVQQRVLEAIGRMSGGVG